MFHMFTRAALLHPWHTFMHSLIRPASRWRIRRAMLVASSGDRPKYRDLVLFLSALRCGLRSPLCTSVKSSQDGSSLLMASVPDVAGAWCAEKTGSSQALFGMFLTNKLPRCQGRIQKPTFTGHLPIHISGPSDLPTLPPFNTFQLMCF